MKKYTLEEIMDAFEECAKQRQVLEDKIDKAIEFIKNAQYDDELKNNVYGLTYSGTQKLLEILGDEEYGEE